MYPSPFEKNQHQSQTRKPQVKVQEANAVQLYMLEDENFQYVLKNRRKMEHNPKKNQNMFQDQNQGSILETITEKSITWSLLNSSSFFSKIRVKCNLFRTCKEARSSLTYSAYMASFTSVVILPSQQNNCSILLTSKVI